MKLVAIVIAMALAGCEEHNPYFCAGHPDNNCTLGPDSQPSCTSSAMCPSGVCDTTLRQCVTCTVAEPAACTGTTPVCGTDDMCHGCTFDVDCASHVCMPDGSCANAAAVLYAKPTGNASSTCPATDKCTFEQAVAVVDETHNVIALDSGTYSLATTLSLAKDMTIVGRGAIIDKASGPNGQTLGITGGKTVTLAYLTIVGGDDGTIGHGVYCQNATLIARNVTVQNNAASGIVSNDCNLTVDRSRIYNNILGGIAITGTIGTFALTNNFIVRNGNTNSGNCGGVNIGLAAPSPAGLFDFNTIVDNHSASGGARSGGVLCDIGGFAAANNIIARNDVGGSTTMTTAQLGPGNCTYPSSLVQSDVVGLGFSSPDLAPYTYELTPGSIAVDEASTPSSVDRDNDGDHRPQGLQKDIGADELAP